MDIVGVDTDFLDAEAKVHDELPIGSEDHLTFVRSEPGVIPFPDGCFDVVTAWSVFEHVTEPRKLLREIYRVLRPGGVIFIQVWPLWSSENGSHLWPFFDEGFVHLTLTPEEIRTVLHEKLVDPELAESMFAMYESCNRKTVDQIQRALIQTGFHFRKVKLTELRARSASASGGAVQPARDRRVHDHRGAPDPGRRRRVGHQSGRVFWSPGACVEHRSS